MKPQNILIISLGIVLMLPGCVGRVRERFDELFYQGKIHADHEQTVKPFLKGVRLYDQFDTVAIFDALWLSDAVRTVYAQIYAKMVGKDEEAYIDFLRRELSANTYFVSFYVLSLSHIPLTEEHPLWVVHLEVDGKKYVPVSVKLAEMPTEYIGFFGKRVNNHKRPYEVRFDRKDSEGKDILADKKEMKLFFSSPRYYDSLTWKLDDANAIVVPVFNPIEL